MKKSVPASRGRRDRPRYRKIKVKGVEQGKDPLEGLDRDRGILFAQNSKTVRLT